MLSIFAPHFFNWTEQLKDSGHEVYWLDIFDSNTKVPQINFVHQIIGWRYKWKYPGRYRVKEKLPRLNEIINFFNERKFSDFFEQKLKEIKPDVVHSFVMQSAVLPVEKVMARWPTIKWIYSSWGSDLYHYKQDQTESVKMQTALREVDFLFTDCQRDFIIAKSLGFSGSFLGVFPGRGGFNFGETDPFMRPLKQRDIILVKGYQGKHGRSIPVLQALSNLQEELKNCKVIIFGTNKEVRHFVAREGLPKVLNLEVLGNIPHSRIMELMGKTKIYLGNSLSDGIPNTLLEAIIMGAFPIQSNPGGVTEELISPSKNGLLIEDPEDPKQIRENIREALKNTVMVEKGTRYNLDYVKPLLSRERIKRGVLQSYKLVERSL